MNRELLLEVLADALAGRLPADDLRLAGTALELQAVAGRVYVLRGGGANVGVLSTREGFVLVDDTFTPLVPRIKEALRTLDGVGRIRFVVNTHWHLDHTDGNRALGDEAVLIAQAATRRRLAAFRARVFSEPKSRDPALPALTFEDALTLCVGGEELRLLHLGPGHTDGDAVAHFVKSNVVQLGDLFVTYGLPFVDRASGGSAAGVARALRRLFLELPQDVRVIPGHGSVSGRDDVLAFAAVLEECLDAVSAARGRGYTLAEMTAGKVLGDHARLAGPFISAEAFLAMLYQEVAAGDEEGTSR